MFTLAPRVDATPVTVNINFSGTFNGGPLTGQAYSGGAQLTLGPDSRADASFPTPTLPPIPGGPATPPPSGTVSLSASDPRVDPPNAQAITGATGIFTVGGSSYAIAGIVPISATQAAPSTGEYIPSSLTHSAGGATYDNLFYADPDGPPLVCLWYFGTDGSGNPITAAKYPTSGGFLDPYGVMLTLSGSGPLNGGAIDLWSNGFFLPAEGMPGPLNYGVLLFTAENSLAGMQFDGATAAVPEPGLLWLFGAALLGVFGWRRAVESRKAVSAD